MTKNYDLLSRQVQPPIVKDVMELTVSELTDLKLGTVLSVYGLAFHSDPDVNIFAQALDFATSDRTVWFVLDTLLPDLTVTNSGICDEK